MWKVLVQRVARADGIELYMWFFTIIIALFFAGIALFEGIMMVVGCW